MSDNTVFLQGSTATCNLMQQSIQVRYLIYLNDFTRRGPKKSNLSNITSYQKTYKLSYTAEFNGRI